MVDGTVSVFTIQGKTVTPAGTVEVGGLKAGGGMVAIAPDGRTALVSRRDDNRVSVLSIDGSKVEYTKRDMTAGVRPIVLDIASNGAFAVVGSLGGGSTGDHDSVSLIDLTAKPPRVVDTIGVLGSTAEGLKISPDSSVVAVVVHNGSNRAKDSPFYNDAGKLVVVRVTGKMLSRVAEAPIGHWSQGAAFSPDSKTILVGNMVEKDYWVFQWDGSTLRDTGQRVKMNGGPAAIRTAEK
jgi:DNA-binding beta-propeller fold protein YncE